MATRKTSEFAVASEMAAAEFLIRQGANKRLPLSVVQTWVNGLIAAGGSGGGLPAATLDQMKTGTSNVTTVTPLRHREYWDQFGLGATYTTAKTDLNNSVLGELFSYTDATAHTPVAGSYGRGITIPSGPKYCTQIAVENTTGVMSVRFNENDVWSAWKTVGAGGGSAGGGPLKALMLDDDSGGSTSLTLKTILTINVEANKVYQLEGRMLYRMGAITDKIRIALGGTAGTQSQVLRGSTIGSGGEFIVKNSKAKDEAMEFATAQYAGDNNMLELSGQIFATGAGTITIQYSSGTAGVYCSAMKGSSFTLQEVGTIVP